MIKTATLFCALALSFGTAMAQTKIKDGTASGGSLPNANALLELESTNKGFLLPRIVLTATDAFAPLSAHVAGMTVYNTATSGSGTTAVVPGYYYNDGSQWVKINQPEPWHVANTSDPTVQATSNTQDIYQSGKVGIGTATPNSTFQVNGSVSNAIRVISASRTLDNTDYTIIISSGATSNGGTQAGITANTATVTLPQASTCAGRIYTIINASGSSQTIQSYDGTTRELKLLDDTSNGSGLAAPVASYVLSMYGASWNTPKITMQSDGQVWWAIAYANH